jgi:type II secretory pathway pseudopilin PulG
VIKFTSKARLGFNTAEILSSIALVGVLSAIVLPSALNTVNPEDDERRDAVFSDLNTLVQSESIEMGLPPLEYGPGVMFEKRLNEFESATVEPTEACEILANGAPIGNSAFTLKNGFTVITSNTWDDSRDYDLQVPGLQAGRHVCVMSASERASGEGGRVLTLVREGNMTVAMNTSTPDVVIDAERRMENASISVDETESAVSIDPNIPAYCGNYPIPPTFSGQISNEVRMALKNGQMTIATMDTQNAATNGNESSSLDVSEYTLGFLNNTGGTQRQAQSATQALLGVQAFPSQSMSRELLAANHMAFFDSGFGTTRDYNLALANNDPRVMNLVRQRYCQIQSELAANPAETLRSLTTNEVIALRNAVRWMQGVQNANTQVSLSAYATAHVGNTGASYSDAMMAAVQVDKNGNGLIDLPEIMAYYITAYRHGGQFNSRRFNNDVAASNARILYDLNEATSLMNTYFEGVLISAFGV